MYVHTVATYPRTILFITVASVAIALSTLVFVRLQPPRQQAATGDREEGSYGAVGGSRAMGHEGEETLVGPQFEGDVVDSTRIESAGPSSSVV